MSTQIILPNNEVNTDWVNYVKVEAEALSRLDDFSIDNYADRELFNPEMQELLGNLNEETDETAMPENLTLSFSESSASRAAAGLFGRFRELKKRIRKIICEILGTVGENGVPSWEDIIRTVLLAVAGTIFGGALGAIALPIIIAFIAKVIRRGIGAVCPV